MSFQHKSSTMLNIAVQEGKPPRFAHWASEHLMIVGKCQHVPTTYAAPSDRLLDVCEAETAVQLQPLLVCRSLLDKQLQYFLEWDNEIARR